AGVGRVTVYRHFPDEPTLSRACSGQYFERNQPPDPDRWRAIDDARERLRAALRETARDHPATAPYHELWREATDVLVEPWRVRGRRRVPRRDRARAQLRHLAHARPGAGAHGRTGGRADAQASVRLRLAEASASGARGGTRAAGRTRRRSARATRPAGATRARSPRA